MDSRAQFEEWFNSDYNEDLHAKMVVEFAKSIAWEAWQESRAAIEVELPEKVMVEDEYDRGHNYGIEYCEEAIKAAEIRIKGESS